jgi:hypothetical protein
MDAPMRPRTADVIGLAAIQCLVPFAVGSLVGASGASFGWALLATPAALAVGPALFGVVKSRFGSPLSHWRLALYTTALLTALAVGYYASGGPPPDPQMAVASTLTRSLGLGVGATLHFGLCWLLLALTWRTRR